MNKFTKIEGVIKSKALSLFDHARITGAADVAHYAATVEAHRAAVRIVKAAYKAGPDKVAAAMKMYKEGHAAGYLSKAPADMAEALKLSRKAFTDLPKGKDKARIAALRETGKNATDTAWSRVNKEARPETVTRKPDATAPATEPTEQGATVTKGPDQKTSEADKARATYLQTINRATTRDLPLLQTLAWAAEHPAQFLKIMETLMPK